MTHRLTRKYAKNYCNRTLIVKVIIGIVVTCFLGHSVHRPIVWRCIHLAGAVGRWHCALNCGWLRNIISVMAWKEYTQRHNTHRASWTGCAEGMAKQRTGILVTRRLWRRTFRSSGRGFEKTANWQVHTRPWGRCDTQPSQTIANYRLITKMKHFRWRNVFDNMCTCVEWAVDHFGLGLTSIHQLLRKIFAKNVIYM